MADWEQLTSIFEAKRSAALAHGGPERLARLYAAGKLDAWQRIETFLDLGSFREFGTFAGSGADAPRDGFIAGSGTLDGRPVLIGAEDATVLGGSIGAPGATKRARLASLARQERAPLVLLLDGAGHRVTNTLEKRNPAPTDLALLADLAGVVPTVVVVHGASAGHGALCAPLCDVVIMVEGQGQLFTAGPPLVAAATGEQIDKESLGGSAVHLESGVAHLGASDDRAALALAQRYLSYFPNHGWEHPRTDATDDARRLLDTITDLIPADGRRPYDIRPVIAAVADAGSVLELQSRFGTALVVALARIGGQPVMVVANQPKVRAGSLDVPAADKASRWIDVAATFHLPLIQLTDNPGVLPGLAAEQAGALRAAARMYVAQHRHPGPKLHVTIRKAYGFGSSVMGQNPYGGQTVTLAFPDATVGAMPARGGSDASGADAATRDELVAVEQGGPWRQADTVSYDEVILPADLRNALLDALRLSSNRSTGPVTPTVSVPLRP